MPLRTKGSHLGPLRVWLWCSLVKINNWFWAVLALFFASLPSIKLRSSKVMILDPHVLLTCVGRLGQEKLVEEVEEESNEARKTKFLLFPFLLPIGTSPSLPGLPAGLLLARIIERC